jgi:hypothetical protein
LGAILKFKYFVSATVLSLVLGCSSGQAATVNVVLSSDGAQFVSATSQIFSSSPACCGGLINGGLSTAQNNLLTATPTSWLANGDTRFIFDNNDNTSALIIKLGSVSDLVSFGATFSSTDRVPGLFSVSTSLDGTTFTPVGSVVDPNSLVSGGAATLFTTAAPVSALYVEYFFGPAIGSNGAPNGAGVNEVFASVAAVPEPSTWAMMILGFIIIGATTYRRRKSVTLAT